jgi:hypothetical protein
LKFYGENYLIINLRYFVKIFFEAGSLCREEEENPRIMKLPAAAYRPRARAGQAGIPLGRDRHSGASRK